VVVDLGSPLVRKFAAGLKKPGASEGPLWVGSHLSECHDFVNLSVAYRPEADVRQAQ
jgi:hypothetical protein